MGDWKLVVKCLRMYSKSGGTGQWIIQAEFMSRIPTRHCSVGSSDVSLQISRRKNIKSCMK